MLDIICGKPGSGKTYHCASMLVDMLTDWCKYEKKNNQKFSRRLFTNIQINVDQLNKVIESRVGFIVLLCGYI
jgi:broad-specificity NMP kinase